jgi:hypothetical protein
VVLSGRTGVGMPVLRKRGPAPGAGRGATAAGHGHQQRGELGRLCGAALREPRERAALSALAHSPAAHAAATRGVAADARRRGDGPGAGHADIVRHWTTSGRIPGGQIPRCGRTVSTCWRSRRKTGNRRPLAHPPELTYPCCLPALGEFGEVVPHEGSTPSLTDLGCPAEPRWSPLYATSQPGTEFRFVVRARRPVSSSGRARLRSVAARSPWWSARRIRLVAYGARLESVLG